MCRVDRMRCDLASIRVWPAVVVLAACGARTDLQSERDADEPREPTRPPACLEDGRWTQVGDLAVARAGPALAAVEGGQAIIAGGFGDDPLDTVERYDARRGASRS